MIHCFIIPSSWLIFLYSNEIWIFEKSIHHSTRWINMFLLETKSLAHNWNEHRNGKLDEHWCFEKSFIRAVCLLAVSTQFEWEKTINRKESPFNNMNTLKAFWLSFKFAWVNSNHLMYIELKRRWENKQIWIMLHKAVYCNTVNTMVILNITRCINLKGH